MVTKMIDSINNISTNLSATFEKLKNSDNFRREEKLADYKISQIKQQEIKSDQENTKKKVDYSVLENGLKELLSDTNMSIEFSLDKESKQMIMRVVDEETDEVIKQFPTDLTLKIARIISQAIENGRITNVQV